MSVLAFLQGILPTPGSPAPCSSFVLLRPYTGSLCMWLPVTGATVASHGSGNPTPRRSCSTASGSEQGTHAFRGHERRFCLQPLGHGIVFLISPLSTLLNEDS